ncbi:MAG: AAA family ATPase [Acetatifactor sp.]
MGDTITVKEAAKLWEITERRVTVLCKEGRIEGAYKKNRSWVIPMDAEKPADSRIKTGVYRKTKTLPDLPLPVGISDYRLASSEYYYVDKTMMIKDFLDERPMVSLFTRPRRFGKTLNMDMIRTFFEKTDEDTSVYFRDKKIWACGKKYRDYQGKYPVIFITFKDVKRDSWEETYDQISKILIQEFERHSELLESERCSKYEKSYFKNVLEGKAGSTDMMMSLQRLSQMLDEHYEISPIIIIDEYDTPIQQGHMSGFYDKVILFMRNLFSGGLKDNRHLSYGFLTGILRVAKESIFSGLNNLKVNSILDNRYSGYFGFTPEEVKAIARYYHAEEKYAEICAWYDGYRFGETEIFNPWSVINYFSNGCQPKAFWQSTGSNEIIGEILTHAGEEIYERLNALLQGESFLTYIDTGVIYPQIRNNPSSVYSFLLVAGYLKAVRADPAFSGDYMCEVALPNREIAFVYKKEILQKLADIIPQATAISIQEALYSNDAQRLQKEVHKLLLQSASCYDTAGENFYHGFFLGLCAIMDNRYYISSNGESGMGRYDIQLLPKSENLPGILIELKAGRNFSGDKLKQLSETALAQIQDRKYDTDMISKGVKTVFKYGVAFSGKQVEIAVASQ